jgi:hypothetical protein
MLSAWRRVLHALAPAGASAAVRTFSITLNPNPAGPTFGNLPQQPLVPITISYDDQAGTITASEGGATQTTYDPSLGMGF